MKIGTAVPSQEELASATHHFIQNKSIFENYSVGDFEQEAIAKLDELFLKNNIQIMVGGSGLYVDAVLKGFDDFPDVDTSIRDEIRKKYEDLGISYLQNSLKTLDSEYYNFLLEASLNVYSTIYEFTECFKKDVFNFFKYSTSRSDHSLIKKIISRLMFHALFYD